MPLSIAHLRRQDDLAYLKRRSVIPDTEIVCPIRVRGKVEKILFICAYGGNVFASEDDLETLEIVTTLLGLVQTKAIILFRAEKGTLGKNDCAPSSAQHLFPSRRARSH